MLNQFRESVAMESEPDGAQVSAMGHDPDLDSLLEYPFGAGNMADIDSLYNESDVSSHGQPDFNQDQPSGQQMEPQTESTTGCFWNPFWSSPALLFAYSTVLALLSATTVVLWRLSVSNHGFPLLTANNYAWTYGPTAVLTIIMSVWNQTTYYCKLLEPWKQLKTGPLGPEKTVLLDYISPILPVNLWKATRFRHAPVLIAIYAGIVLRIVTVASTGLLSPVKMPMPFQNITLEALSAFNTDNYDLRAGSFDTLRESAINYEAYALIADNLPFPDGIQPSLAFQRFRLPDNSTANRTLSSVRATVQAFKPSIQCEEASMILLNATTEPREQDYLLRIFANLSWASCSSSQLHPNELNVPFSYLPLTRQSYGGIADGDYTCRDTTESFWSFVALFDVRYNQTAIPSTILRAEQSNSSDTWGIQIVEATSVACSISYSMVPAQVTYDLSRDTVTPVIDLPDESGTYPPGPFIEGFPASDFSNRLYSGARDAEHVVGSFITNGMDEFAPNTFVQMMSIVGNTTPTDFLGNPGLMSSAASTVFTYAGVQVANAFLVADTTEALQGEISTTTTRLQVSPLASLATVSGLLVVAVGAMVLVLIRAHDVIMHKVGPIGGMAKILRASPSLNVLLRGCGQKKMKHIEKVLNTFTFQSTTVMTQTSSTSIIARREGTAKEDSSELSLVESITWWRPIPLRPWIFTLISLTPLAIITTMEVLQHLSRRTNGITSIANPDSLLVTFGTRFVPSTLFMTIAILYDAIEFNIMVLAPFARLKRGRVKGKPVMTHTLLGRFSIESLGFSLWNKYWATAFATLAAFLGSFLTIAASGLYTIERLPCPSPATIRRVDQFDPTWSDSVNDDGGAAISLTNFEVSNLSFPSWTNSELAFPKLQLSSKDLSQINATSEPSIMVRVPAIRGELQCSITSMEDLVVDIQSEGPISARLVVNGSSSVPATCGVGVSTIGWSSKQLLDYTLQPWLLGQMLDLHPGDKSFSFGEFTLPLQDNSPPGCPSLAFTFGNYSTKFLDYTDTSLDAPPNWFTTMSCIQLMAEIQTDVNLSIPDFTVISAAPDESTTKYLASGANGQTAFPWRPQIHFELEVIIWDSNMTYGGFGNAWVVQNYANAAYEVDGFFSLLLHPSNKVYPEELLGPDNHGRLLDAIQGLYRRYMAQVANTKMRVPLAANGDPETYTATWINTNRGVLRQDWRSKLALQILLAVMFVCGVASYLLIDTEEVLPHDPCSIAGLASLLAGSSICEEEEPMNSEGSKGGRIPGSPWDSQLFGLGWWRLPAGGERFGIDMGSAQWK